MLLPPPESNIILTRLDVLVMSSKDVTPPGLEAAAQQLKEMAWKGETRVRIPGLTPLLKPEEELTAFHAFGGKWRLCEHVVHQSEPAILFRAGSVLAVLKDTGGYSFRRGDIADGLVEGLVSLNCDTRHKLPPIQLPLGLFVQLALIHRGSLRRLDLRDLEIKEIRFAQPLQELSGFKR